MITFDISLVILWLCIMIMANRKIGFNCLLNELMCDIVESKKFTSRKEEDTKDLLALFAIVSNISENKVVFKFWTTYKSHVPKEFYTILNRDKRVSDSYIEDFLK